MTTVDRSEGNILFAELDGVHVLRFLGDVRLTLGPALEQYIGKAMQMPEFVNIIIDLR